MTGEPLLLPYTPLGVIGLDDDDDDEKVGNAIKLIIQYCQEKTLLELGDKNFHACLVGMH